MTHRKKDTLYRNPYPPYPFEFNDAVAGVFDDMLPRSVPFYKECLELTVHLTQHFARPRTRVYDLGCSTGTLMLALAKALPKSVRLVGLDNSESMLEQARLKLKRHVGRCELKNTDLNTPISLPAASVAIMNYTLQFIPPKKRGAMLKTIHNALKPGGALILIEKIKGTTSELDSLWVEAHHRFKKRQGYSKLEIAQKRQALENVLVPLTAPENEKLLKQAGFAAREQFFRWSNFAGWVAVKAPTKRRKT